MITQNNFFTSLAGKEVRQYLQEEQCIRRIIDFGHNQIFPNASAYTCLMFLDTSKRDSFEYESLSNGVSARTLDEADFSPITYKSLNPEKWRLVKAGHIDGLRRIESVGKPLSEVASIKVGFATLKDSVFLVRDLGSYCSSGLAGNEAYKIEIGVTRPAVKISELDGQKDLLGNDKRVIFPYRQVGGKYRLMPEDVLGSDYPNTFEYLFKYRGLLESRDKGNKTYEGWYAWGRTQGRDAPGPKLLTKTFSRMPQFFFDDSDQLYCNGYAVFLKDASLFETAFPIKALARILNSKVMHYYLKLTSFQIEGDYQCYQKNFIERFRIVDMDDAQIDELLGLPVCQIDEYVSRLYGLSIRQIDDVLMDKSGVPPLMNTNEVGDEPLRRK